MRLPLIVAVGVLTLLTPIRCADKPKKATRNVEITAEDEKLRDAAGFEAIKELHRLMDDDHSGSIDRFESNDFLQEDLQLTGSDRAQRERAFHHDDDAITVDDMWESWFESDERAWDEQAVLEWLINFVRLPQYEKNFTENKVTGVALPRMALQNSSYLSTVLGIKSYVHRQKLQLKALDLVLFGFHEAPTSKAKDIAIGFMTLLCTGLGFYLRRLYGQSKKQVDELTKKLTEITSMEDDFQGVQKRFDGEETESIKELKIKLQEAEKRLEMSGSEAISYALQPLLRRTYEIEVTCINEKKGECLAEMRDAKEFVDRMRKKQLGIMNSLKLAAGATISGADTVDSKVYSLRARMEKISAAMAECQERWIKIESLCGFSIAGSYEHYQHFHTVASHVVKQLTKHKSAYRSPFKQLVSRLTGIPKPVSGTFATGVQTPITSGSRKNSPPPPPPPAVAAPAPAVTKPVFTVSSTTPETPPSTVTSLTSAVPKSDLPSIAYPKLAQLSEDSHSLASSRSSGSIGRKLNKLFHRKKDKP